MALTSGNETFRVHFEGGPQVEVTAGGGVLVARPYFPVADGVRILVANDDCGIGIVSAGAGLFPAVLGPESSSSLAGAIGLPARIEISLMAPDGSWYGRDVTEAILSMDRADLIALEDGPLPQALASLVEEPFVTAEIAAPVSFYFGRLPELSPGGARVSREISWTDIEQARIVHQWLAPQLEAAPAFSPFG